MTLLGMLLRARRERLGLSQAEVAERLGLPRSLGSYVSRVERGKVVPTERRLSEFGTALSFRLADLQVVTTCIEQFMRQDEAA